MTLKPAIHGRDHRPGGADPMPGPEGTGPGEFSNYVTSFSTLLGYWRLGEGASPFADTSGHAYGPADLTLSAGTPSMDPDVPGALPTIQDDGAVQFLAANTQDGDSLDSDDPTPGRFDLANVPYTVACFIRPAANAATFTAMVAGTYTPGSGGWYLGVVYPARTVFHFRDGAGVDSFAQGAAVDADTWVLVAATWDPTDGHCLYYDGVLVDTDPGTTVVPGFSGGIRVGQAFTGGPSFFSFPGSVDELAIWGEVLTADEIASLYERSIAAVSTEGQALLSDGSGHTVWDYPLEVTY